MIKRSFTVKGSIKSVNELHADIAPLPFIFSGKSKEMLSFSLKTIARHVKKEKYTILLFPIPEIHNIPENCDGWTECGHKVIWNSKHHFDKTTV